ncbi:MAG: class I SAM-dependent methyltransferase [Candidatus Woesearchaeota archaeon]
MKKEKLIKKEEIFHDAWATSIKLSDIKVNEFFEASTAPENRFIIKKLGNIRNKKILDMGCGAGEAAVYFAKKGANVIATDISQEMLSIVKNLAKLYKVNVKTFKCPSHKTPFPNDSFDIVYAANLLHHVNIEETLKEVKRILKKGGIFVSWDPLGHNPIINVYRKIAKEVRTPDEHPLKMGDLKIFKKYFCSVEYKTTWFFTLWIFLRYYFIERIDPNKERYWKKILIDHKKLEKTYYRLEKIDNLFLKLFPFMRRFCWNITIIAVK